MAKCGAFVTHLFSVCKTTTVKTTENTTIFTEVSDMRVHEGTLQAKYRHKVFVYNNYIFLLEDHTPTKIFLINNISQDFITQ